MKRISTSLIIVLLIIALSPVQSFAKSQMTAEEYYNKALESFDLKNYSDALPSFEKAMGLDIKYVQECLNKGDELNKAGKYEEAIGIYDIIVKIDKRNYQAFNSKGMALFYLRRYQDAGAAFTKAILYNSKYIDAYVNKGETLNRLGKYEDALKCFDKATIIDPEDSHINISRGNTFYFQKLYDKAIEYYDEAISQDSSAKYAYTGKGFSLFYLNKYDESISALKDALKLDENIAEANYFLSLAFMNIKDVNSATLYLKKAVVLDRAYIDKARAEELFNSQFKEAIFVETICDAAEVINNKFDNANILKEGLLTGVKFLELNTAGNATDDSKIIQTNQEFIKNTIGGKYYNKSTADIYKISKNSPNRNDIIKVGRGFKKMALVGLTTTFTTTEEKIVYVGTMSGNVKAVIVKVGGKQTVDGVTKNIVNWCVYINNNGTWECYALLDSKEE